MTLTLYHFTTAATWREIERSGQLEPRSHQAAQLDSRPRLWLTDDPEHPEATGIDPARAELLVTIHPENGAVPWTIAREEVPGAGIELNTERAEPSTWYVSWLPISLDRCSQVVDLRANRENKVLRKQAPPTSGGRPTGWRLTSADVKHLRAHITEAVANLGNGRIRDGHALEWAAFRAPKQMNKLEELVSDHSDRGLVRTWAAWEYLVERAVHAVGYARPNSSAVTSQT
ncbi:hypothetical protein ACFYUY_04375 [Kitasatospora sp. NPDC004745]|uniref:hypothetical protein n=1 Tax=Kitasatospora sp. NPDC004745 TaxID=3364019 RepID=UPI0036BDA2F6